MTDVLKLSMPETDTRPSFETALLDIQPHARASFVEAVVIIERRIAELTEPVDDLFDLPLGRWALEAILPLEEAPDWKTELAHDETIDVALRLWGLYRGMRVLSQAERAASPRTIFKGL